MVRWLAMNSDYQMEPNAEELVEHSIPVNDLPGVIERVADDPHTSMCLPATDPNDLQVLARAELTAAKGDYTADEKAQAQG